MLVEPLLKDLEWLLEEREMFVADVSLSQFYHSDWRMILARLKRSPAPLVEHMRQVKSHFLGSYFEQMFAFAVHQFTSLDVMAEHAQIHGGSRTLGEVDLLACDATGQIRQFEIALKFYLERSDVALNYWLGPNKNDSLDRKVAHARAHQLQILETPEGKSWLHSVTDLSTYQAHLLIYGRRFWHLSSSLFTEFAHCLPQGAWVHVGELLDWKDCFEDFQVADKPHWMTAIRNKNQFKQIDTDFVEGLIQTFDIDQRARLFSCKWRDRANQDDIFWLFICPNAW